MSEPLTAGRLRHILTAETEAHSLVRFELADGTALFPSGYRVDVYERPHPRDEARTVTDRHEVTLVFAVVESPAEAVPPVESPPVPERIAGVFRDGPGW